MALGCRVWWLVEGWGGVEAGTKAQRRMMMMMILWSLLVFHTQSPARSMVSGCSTSNGPPVVWWEDGAD